jgi:hypothetical protein
MAQLYKEAAEIWVYSLLLFLAERTPLDRPINKEQAARRKE